MRLIRQHGANEVKPHQDRLSGDWTSARCESGRPANCDTWPRKKFWLVMLYQQEPWRLPSRQADCTATDRFKLDMHSNYQAVTGNQGYFDE